ncbi:MAG TPA: SH3 domain-containing protein [Gemmatimonadales bacterium]|nr:SH3 domain-containing protein [Gemmatimonadales bacterium]
MTTALARSAIAPVLAEARVRAEQVTQLVLGESAVVLDSSGEWRRVCTTFDGYDGWIHSGYLVEQEDSAAEEWRTRATAWCEGAVLRMGGTRLSLPLRARVVLAGDSVELPDGRRGRIAEGSIHEMKDVLAAAKAKAPSAGHSTTSPAALTSGEGSRPGASTAPAWCRPPSPPGA